MAPPADADSRRPADPTSDACAGLAGTDPALAAAAAAALAGAWAAVSIPAGEPPPLRAASSGVEVAPQRIPSGAVAGGGGAVDGGPPQPPDPGRRELASEYLAPGETLLDVPLAYGGSLLVTAHSSVEGGCPEGAPVGTVQEWRVLQFRPEHGATNLLQSVTKVCKAPAGDPPKEWLRCEAMGLDLPKSHVSVALAGLAALGRPVLPAQVARSKEPLRVLCIGLGGGTVPSFFAERLEHCEVDVVELEPSVVEAARVGMGFVEGPRLRVAVEDGAAFALTAARSMADPREGLYDAVLVDAYTAAGDVPEPLWAPDGDLCAALSAGLLRREGGLIATNFLSWVDTQPALEAYRAALAKWAPGGFGFEVLAEGAGNRLAVHTCGGPADLRTLGLGAFAEAMEAAARKIRRATSCPFSMSRLATRRMRSIDEPTEGW